jgi:hypothetical protein
MLLVTLLDFTDGPWVGRLCGATSVQCDLKFQLAPELLADIWFSILPQHNGIISSSVSRLEAAMGRHSRGRLNLRASAPRRRDQCRPHGSRGHGLFDLRYRLPV